MVSEVLVRVAVRAVTVCTVRPAVLATAGSGAASAQSGERLRDRFGGVGGRGVDRIGGHAPILHAA